MSDVSDLEGEKLDDEETEQSDDQHDEQTQELKTHRGCELGQVDPDHPTNENFGDPSGNTNEDQDLAEPSPDEVEASCGGELHWYGAPSMAPLWAEALQAIDDLLWGGGASGLKRYSFCRRRRMREKGKGMDILRGRVLRS